MNEIRKTQQRARAYNLSDGIAEIVAGGALVLIGCGFLVANPVDSDTLRILSLVNMFALTLLSWWIIRMLKERITYPRTGYVRSPKSRLTYGQRLSLNLLVTLICVPLLLEFVGDVFRSDGSAERALYLAWSGLIAASVVTTAIRLRMPRFFAIAAVIAATALVTTFAGIPGAEKVGFLATGAGATAVVTGTYALKSHLKLHPKPAEDVAL